ncbi:Transcription factor TFIID complex subunit Taf3 [Schizosaccharomyces pombe]|uniref:Transcription initiation factor TFIID subunit 3 n=1 Tax=Schizosaccharomyces pombe (strain 972 / ATCC 24843) TaxID=284812 RepID=TAF3_SCHPO|nr:putative transcription factor TFIID complex subunit Taf3 [Schizosaccharomyces pombe]Q9P6P0.1 RecName: Full=Transcription initiation factor TFIID subunit 3; AltName: Full=TBP-associated factor 3 [Schizosaccharomyces pombe 972h-]CAB90151.1 transcription factor TFIID complex subunit Taf3 (predicted) [Schizosaccharomyces pombe]|eukprot:NP_593833.1 putative transcription factor TFIID complex subunit Taf3 [Schizosaccharomyces pombe]
MEETQIDELYFSLMRIFCSQTLRAAGIDRTKVSLLNSFTDITIRYIRLLSETAMAKAEVGRRSCCDLGDLRLAMEEIGLLNGSEEDVKTLVEWFNGPQVAELRRVSGFVQDSETQVKPKDWLTSLIQKQIRVSGPERFYETVFSASNEEEDVKDS